MERITDDIIHVSQLNPGATALEGGDGPCSYAVLVEQVTSMSHLLLASGIGQGMTVALCLPNSSTAIIGLLGILHAGACSVNLNPGLHPRETLALAGRSCVSASLLTHRQYELIQANNPDSAMGALGSIFLLPESWDRLGEAEVHAASKAAARPERKEILDADALMIYTSGTSGAPKGVILTHQNLLDRSRGAIEVMGITACDRTLMTLPLCHVFGLTRQLFPHLLQGATINIASSSAPLDLLNYMIDSRGVTTFSGVPYHFYGMLERGAGTRYPMKTLRLATSSSMRMLPGLRQALATSLPHTRFSAQYGLTETSGFVTALHPDLFLSKPDSVGKAIPGVEVKVAQSEVSDAFGIGLKGTGELLVQGAGVMRCYLNDQDATGRAFTSDGWFRTGDIASMDAEGDVTIISRKQHLIKRAGEFVIPEEVESIITQHPAVAEACVFGVPHQQLGESVCAVAILRHGMAASDQELREFCRKNLARFKIPEDIRFMDALQKTSLGKVNKRAVAHQYMDQSAIGQLDGTMGRSASSLARKSPLQGCPE